MAVATEPGGVTQAARPTDVPARGAVEAGGPSAAARDVLASREFRGLVTRRWRVSLGLTAVLFVIYYGYILLVATDRALLATRVGEVTTLGIVLGVLE